MRPDQQEFAESLKLTAVAVLSAVVTATVVIGAGRLVLDEPQAVSRPAALVHVVAR